MKIPDHRPPVISPERMPRPGKCQVETIAGVIIGINDVLIASRGNVAEWDEINALPHDHTSQPASCQERS